jgi:hypothetical protein
MNERRVNVVLRVRPLFPHEQREPSSPPLFGTASNGIQRLKWVEGKRTVTLRKDKKTETEFRFDRVFGPIEGTQEAVFHDSVSPLVDHVLRGFHGTCFAYGQTGAGKTYTMEGYDYDRHQNPLFEVIQSTF